MWAHSDGRISRIRLIFSLGRDRVKSALIKTGREIKEGDGTSQIDRVIEGGDRTNDTIGESDRETVLEVDPESKSSFLTLREGVLCVI